VRSEHAARTPRPSTGRHGMLPYATASRLPAAHIESFDGRAERVGADSVGRLQLHAIPDRSRYAQEAEIGRDWSLICHSGALAARKRVLNSPRWHLRD
jgi:hypothetical protein